MALTDKKSFTKTERWLDLYYPGCQRRFLRVPQCLIFLLFTNFSGTKRVAKTKNKLVLNALSYAKGGGVGES